MSFLNIVKLSIFRNSTTKLLASQLDDVSYKLKMCSDTKVKQTAQELMNSLNGSTSRKSRKVIDKAEHLLDTVNTANREYCTLYNEWTPLMEGNLNFLDKIIMKFSSKKVMAANKFRLYSAPRVVSNLSHRPEFNNIVRFNSLKRYISRYSDDKEMIKHLYEQYYLKNIDNVDFVNYLRKIDKEFGVKLFADKPLKKSSQLYIYEELMNFKRASSGKVKFQPLVDITDFDPMANIAKVNGICVKGELLEKSQYGARIALEESFIHEKQGFRHELIHGVDDDLDHTILSAGRAKISPKEIKEMKNAGVKNLEYAYKNNNEFKAVFGQGSMSRYSDEFKQKMIKKGLPEWIINLDDVNLAKYLDDLFPDEKSKKILDEIKQNFDGDLPETLMYKIIDNPEKLEKYCNILKYKDGAGKSMFLHSIDNYCDLSKEKLDFVERFSKLTVKESYIEELKAEGFATDSLLVNLGNLAYYINDFSVEQLEKIYQKAQKCKTSDDYNNLNSLLVRYLRIKSKIT